MINLETIIGRRIVRIEENAQADEGVLIYLDDGRVLHVGWSWHQGVIELRPSGFFEVSCGFFEVS